jgi:hypothetical protein
MTFKKSHQPSWSLQLSHKFAKLAVTPLLHARLCPDSSDAALLLTTALLHPGVALVEVTDNSSQVPVCHWILKEGN